MEDLETRHALARDRSFRWRRVPASLSVFLGFFILITSLGPFVSATFFPTQIDAGVSVTISRTLAVINAAGITWIIAGWMWYRGHWWWAVICTLTGMMLISVGLPDR